MTDDERELLLNAWALAGEDKAFVPQPWALPDAERLREAGWLRRRLLPNSDPAYSLTAQAEQALDLAALQCDAEQRTN